MYVTVLLLSILPMAYATSCGFGGFSDNDKNEILKAHNDLRSSIAKGTFVAKTNKKPAAADMQVMQWDCALEKSAQAWANTCPKFGPNAHSKSSGLGENIYWSWSTAPISPTGKGGAASKSWANEFQQYGWPSNTFTSSGNIGHATQMAWAKTNKVGCGVKQCPSSNPKFKYEIAVVCQYTPQGNMLGSQVYTTGKTCSKCQKSCQTNTGLCSP